ncbi:MAG: hypothetical protein JWN60_2363 [Acidobacteria bacterium]|nr:hypothetical protein [Acidobacteriota bacterium]
MKKEVKIGTSGFRTNKTQYAEILSCVEIQHTFYQPPQIKTLERWRAEVPADFEFAVKAWQLITHEAKSPTYKRLKKTLTDAEREEAGYFKPTAIVKEARGMTLACARALEAKTILFQCPASFKQNTENISNLKSFFSDIERENLNFAWEPRGNWNDAEVKNICDELDLWHVVDPFEKITTTPDRCYYRLHGRGGWRYKYEEDELAELAALMPQNSLSYVFFNNIHMTEDALKFKELLNEAD